MMIKTAAPRCWELTKDNHTVRFEERGPRMTISNFCTNANGRYGLHSQWWTMRADARHEWKRLESRGYRRV